MKLSKKKFTIKENALNLLVGYNIIGSINEIKFGQRLKSTKCIDFF